jgi:hypothetical protein
VALCVGRLGAALGEREELVAQVDEGHPRHPSAQLDLEDAAIERERLVEVAHVECDVVDADRPGAFAHAA